MLPSANVRTPVTSGTNGHDDFVVALRHAQRQLRRDLPWIGHPSPWAILVSEFMLQQTSVPRVIPKWELFLQRFPNPEECANARQSEVVRLWQGLGYPRRAQNLHRSAQTIVHHFAGEVPRTVEELLTLPGVGDYTARAMATFAFDRPVGVVDTNVGRILARAVQNAPLAKAEAQRLADSLVPARSAAAWNQSMLDLGAQFCRPQPRCGNCPVRSACRWNAEGGDDPAERSAGVSRRQPAFRGSRREQRGLLVRYLGDGPATVAQLRTRDGIDVDRLNETLDGLVRDELVVRQGRRYQLRD